MAQIKKFVILILKCIEEWKAELSVFKTGKIWNPCAQLVRVSHGAH